MFTFLRKIFQTPIEAEYHLHRMDSLSIDSDEVIPTQSTTCSVGVQSEPLAVLMFV